MKELTAIESLIESFAAVPGGYRFAQTSEHLSITIVDRKLSIDVTRPIATESQPMILITLITAVIIDSFSSSFTD
jgi:hypothetical protein